MIVGLHGKMGAGKNETARRIKHLLDAEAAIAGREAFPVIEVSFARKLKESAAALLGITLRDLEAFKNDPSKIVALGYDGLGFMPFLTFREFLQRYGTESHRDVFGVDFWLDAALPFGQDYSGALYVVTDVRFPNEAERVRSLGGVVVKIIGPVEETGDHASERPLNCDWTIDNTIRDDAFANLDAEIRNLFSPSFWVSQMAIPAMEGVE